MGRRNRKIYKIGAGDALYVISAPTVKYLIPNIQYLTRTRPLRLQAGTKKATTLLTEFLHKKQGFRGLGPCVLRVAYHLAAIAFGRHHRHGPEGAAV